MLQSNSPKSDSPGSDSPESDSPKSDSPESDILQVGQICAVLVRLVQMLWFFCVSRFYRSDICVKSGFFYP